MRKQYFPYPFREGQEEFIKFTRSNLKKGSVCLNAPTGFGKTPAILAALLPHTKDYSIIWAVRTGNETDRPIEELKTINKKTKSKFFGLSYRGKRDMCLLARELKLGSEIGYDGVSFLCKSQKNNCKYDFDYFNPNRFLKEPMLYSEILKICRDKGLCPYKVQRQLLGYADVVSLSYNYIVHEGMGWSIRRDIPFEYSYLVVDESHNLQYACMNLNSDKITLGTVAYALREIEKFDTPKAREVKEFIQILKEELEGILRDMGGKEEEFDIKDFQKYLARKSGIQLSKLDEVFSSIRRYGTKIRQNQLKEGKSPHSSLYHLSNFWLSVIENLGVDGIAFIKRKERKKLIIEMWDMRAAVILRDRWKEFKGCIFCSGTLNPINAFAETIGLRRYNGKSFQSLYPAHNITSLITKSLSTKGDKLSKKMAEKYITAIEDFIKRLNTNLAIFSASYRIQNSLIRAGLKDIVKNEGRKFYQETQGMSGDKAREILDDFKECAYNDQRGVLCATTTGRFAEGADFPGKELEGIFLVGIPFDRMSVKTKLYLDYYKRLYGRDKGNYYAYIVPALRRASQSLGRALRSKEDRAVFICGDERYGDKRFFQLLPKFICENAEVINYEMLSEKLKSWEEIRLGVQLPYLFDILRDAISENRTIKMKYRSKRTLTERLVDPYEVRDSMYVVGYCHLRSEMRTFRVDRIVDLNVTDGIFTKKANEGNSLT